MFKSADFVPCQNGRSTQRPYNGVELGEYLSYVASPPFFILSSIIFALCSHNGDVLEMHRNKLNTILQFFLLCFLKAEETPIQHLTATNVHFVCTPVRNFG